MGRLRLGLVMSAVLLVIAVSGCGEEITPTSTPTATVRATPIPTAAPTAAATVTPAPTAAPAPAETPSAVFLEVTEPQNESVVSTATIVVRGRTAPDAVVSVLADDTIRIADVDASGSFSATVTLVEGANFIEVAASDLLGDEASVTLVVVYIP